LDAALKISIIVPAFNEEKLIERSLQSIRTAATSFSQLGWQHEIIVCDNNSSDRTGELARAQGARVVFEPTNQISRARNAGAAAANGQWLIFVDADSFPSAELFTEMAAHIQNGRCIGGGATVTLDETVRWAIAFIWIWNCLSRWRRWMAGSFVFCQARAFWELNGFTQELFVAEEIDFSKRLKDLAKLRGEQVIILHRHPLKTSARKVHLYSWNEQMLFLLRSFWGLGRTFKDPKACAPWYDGRR
jgi:glycosyltransferase involved in cell wall biosynthesis